MPGVGSALAPLASFLLSVRRQCFRTGGVLDGLARGGGDRMPAGTVEGTRSSSPTWVESAV
jgi:hypothetical protein